MFFKRLKRTMALVLSAAMVMTGMSVPAYAGEPEDNMDILPEEAALRTEADEATEAGSNRKSEDVAKESRNRIWLVGDSTVCTYETTEGDPTTHKDKYYYPRYGWGTKLHEYLNDDYEIRNIALSGRSSRDFVTRAEYTQQLMGDDGIRKGDVLIICFGHNDEKYENLNSTYTKPSADENDEESIAYYLYNYYYLPAHEVEAETILCTPIVRRDSTGKYEGAKIHDTSQKTDIPEGYKGDYSKAIRDFAAKYNDIHLVDLTNVTRDYYMSIPQTSDSISENSTLYMHSWSSHRSDTVDDTHLNDYGAKVVARLFAQEIQKDVTSALSPVVKEVLPVPVQSELKPLPGYVIPPYKAPTGVSTLYGSQYTTPDGLTFNPTIFGSIGSTSKDYFSFSSTADSKAVIKATQLKGGKVTATEDGFCMYYYQLPVGSEYVFTARATIKDILTGDKQGAFGIMARDDMYLNLKDNTIVSNYVAAGSLTNPGECNCFYRAGTTLGGMEKLTKETIEVGKSYDLKIVSNSDGYACTFGSEPTQTGGYDFKLATIDGDYEYVGLFVSRQGEVEFDDVHLYIKDETGRFALAGKNVEGKVYYGDNGEDEKTPQEKAVEAQAEGRGSVNDTARVTVSANKKNKKTYSIDAAPAAKNGAVALSVTLAKGTKVNLTGLSKKAGSKITIAPEFKKFVKVSSKGVLTAKKATEKDKPARIEYTIPRENGAITVTLDVTVLQPAISEVWVSGNRIDIDNKKAKKGLVATIDTRATDIDIVLDMPLTFKNAANSPGDTAFRKLVNKNKSVLSEDLNIGIGADGRIHITAAKALKKGTVTIPFNIYGKKFTAKIKVKKAR